MLNAFDTYIFCLLREITSIYVSGRELKHSRILCLMVKLSSSL